MEKLPLVFISRPNINIYGTKVEIRERHDFLKKSLMNQWNLDCEKEVVHLERVVPIAVFI